MFVAFKRVLPLALLLGAAATLPSACASNDSSIFIRGCLATTDRTGCTYSFETTSEFIFGGTIDAAYAGEYHCIAVVENQMVPQDNPQTLQTETDGVELFEAEVQVLDPSQGNAALTEFSVPISGYIDPSMGTTAGIGGTDILVVDNKTLKAEAAKVASSGTVQTVVASIIAVGRTLGGQTVHTQDFLFPIEIYNDSSCYEPAGTQCCGGTTASTTLDCRLAVDESTSCSLICSYLGACDLLECPIDANGNSILTEAHCPAHSPPNDSCCNPAAP